jgi:hypothetical protein
MKKLITAAVLLYFFILPDAYACTAFLVFDGKRALAGNNEDFWNSKTQMRFVPAQNGKYGGVYFGFDDGFPQGGMNDQGLFFDGFATAPLKVKKSLNKESFRGNLIEKAMEECATVDEVVALFDRYNLQILERAMLMFGDRHGDSVIIEGDEFLRKEGKFQVVTNFYQSRTAPGGVSCDRFKIATTMLEKADAYTVNLCRRVLAAVHNEIGAPTQYSNIYDLNSGIVYLYHFHNFENEVKLNLEKELEKGARTVEIASLFPRTFAAEAFKQRKAKEVREEREKRRAKKMDPALLEDYLGKYQVDPKLEPETFFELVRKGDSLNALLPDGERLELIPEGKDRFFQIIDFGSVNLTFFRNEEGKVVALDRELLGQKVRCEKVN